MNELASTVSGLPVPVLVCIAFVVAVSALADLWTKSFSLFFVKALILVGGSHLGPALDKALHPIWGVGLLFGLSIVSLVRAKHRLREARHKDQST